MVGLGGRTVGSWNVELLEAGLLLTTSVIIVSCD